MGYFLFGGGLGLVVSSPTYPEAVQQIIVVQGCILLAGGAIVVAINDLRDFMKGSKNGN